MKKNNVIFIQREEKILEIMLNAHKYSGLQKLYQQQRILFFYTLEHFADCWTSWSIFDLKQNEFLARRIYWHKIVNGKVLSHVDPVTFGNDQYISAELVKKIITSFPKGNKMPEPFISIDDFFRRAIIDKFSIDYTWGAMQEENSLYDQWLLNSATLIDAIMLPYKAPYK